MKRHPSLKERLSHACAVLKSLRFQVVAIMLLCYFIPVVLLGIFTQTVLLSGLRENTLAALSSSVEHAWIQTTQNVEHAITLARDAIYDGELTDTYTQWNAGAISDAEYLRLSRGYLDRKYSRDSLFTFAVYFPLSRPDLYMYTRTGSSEAMNVLRQAQAQVMAVSGELDTYCRFMELDGQPCLVRNLVSLRMERYGMLVLGIDAQALFSAIDSLATSWQAETHLMLDDYGDTGRDWAAYPVGLNDQRQLEDITYVCVSEDDEDLRLLLTVNRRALFREMVDYRRLVWGIYLLLIPILILLALYVRRRIVKPVALLSDASRRIEAGELGVTVPLRGGDELGDLGVTFSNMSSRLKELIDKTYKEEINLKNAQIQALQSRINPHFINNALEDINWQARMEGSEAISAMVTSLSVLLNATMAHKDRRIVTLREELEVADAYIYFVQQRFGSEIEIERDIDAQALDGIVPLLTVQPVLENAVEHGIAPAGSGRISLRFRMAGDCLRIDIANTGRQMDGEDREKIDAALRGETMTGNHLGLANIANRLQLIYGARAAIRVFTGNTGETVVEMDIPQSV